MTKPNAYNPSMRKQPPRRVFERFLKPHLYSHEVAEVQRADDYVDQALQILELEEPGLLDWLSMNSDVDNLLKAHASASYALVLHDTRNGKDVDEIAARLNALTYRTLAAAVWHGVMRDRARAERV